MTIRLGQLEIADYDLGLRGKVMRADKLESSAGGMAFCTIVHGLSLVDEVTDTPTSGQFNGYPDAVVRLDESTRIELPWRDDLVAVIGDLVDSDGDPLKASARGQVQRLQDRYEHLGLMPILGFEYELWIFEADVPGSSPGEFVPLGHTENAYSLSRAHQVHGLIVEFAERMETIGAPIEAFHSELGPGFFEFAMCPQTPLRAADGAARARQYLRDLCAERGLRASFMAKPYVDRSGAGGHVHSSVTRDGVNVFAEQPGRLSALAEHYLAGLMATMGDFSALFNPFINSYRRLDKESFVAEDASWGIDDRRAALRVLLDTVPGARVEHRRPGADASPYLVAAAILAGGLCGLEESLELPEVPSTTDEALPGDLAVATERFVASERARRCFGPEFVEGFGATRRHEVRQFETWQASRITEWERQRYGVHL